MIATADGVLKNNVDTRPSTRSNTDARRAAPRRSPPPTRCSRTPTRPSSARTPRCQQDLRDALQEVTQAARVVCGS